MFKNLTRCSAEYDTSSLIGTYYYIYLLLVLLIGLIGLIGNNLQDNNNVNNYVS